METLLLVVGAIVFPFVWGWLVHWAMQRVWPRKPGLPSPPPDATNASSRLVDYQI